jgi:translation initiation factor 3 subunit G
MTILTVPPSRHDWADDEDLDETFQELPPPQKITNKDGSTTVIEYRYNDAGQKVKTTRRIRLITHKEVVNPRVAERKGWGKFGASAKDTAGPAPDTTSVGENIIFRPSTNWRKDAKNEESDPNAVAMKDKLKDKKVKCRICNGEHFTARCPYKDTMAPIGEAAGADVAAGLPDEVAPGGGAAGGGGAGGAGAGKKGSYVPPALRGGPGGAGAGERMGGAGGKYGERDDLATLRVTNVRFFFYHFFSILPSGMCFFADRVNDRSPRWQRRTSCARCSSASAASRASSWPRTGIPGWPRASRSSASRTARTPSRRATRWTGGASSISSCASSLRRRLRRVVLLVRWDMACLWGGLRVTS